MKIVVPTFIDKTAFLTGGNVTLAIQLSEHEYCEKLDEHPGALAVAMDTDFGAYWCQECVDLFTSAEWIESEGEVPLVPVIQPSP